MIRAKFIRAGVLFAVAAAGTMSCGQNKFTQPSLLTGIVSVRANERFLNSAQRESRELLIDGRVTNIEWDLTGNPSVVLMEGGGGLGGSFYVLVRSLWTRDQFGNDAGFYLLLQWPDRTEDRLQEPLVTSADVLSNKTPPDTLIDCTKGNDTLVRESSWSRSSKQEDQVWIEIFSDSLGSFPADVWRWGAETTDPATPVNAAEFINAITGNPPDSLGSTSHPGAGFLEDLYDMGAGPVRDRGNWTYMLDNFNPGSNVPLTIADKGTRDTRLNRGKPVSYVLWHTVEKPFGPCDINNPIRIDDAGVRDKTWNPGDYVPSFRLQTASESQRDVIGKGAWLMGKWALEVRRNLIARPAELDSLNQQLPPWPDDIQLTPGRHYMMRLTIFDGSTKSTSKSPMIPIYLKP